MQRFRKLKHELVGLICTSFMTPQEVGSGSTVDGMNSAWRPKASLEEDLECPVCWEHFNDLENTPYVLWCGHTLCRDCVMGLQGAHVKLTALCWHLPFFISCPWCQFPTLRLTWKGCLKYPCKNFFLLGIIDSLQRSSRPQDRSQLTDHVEGDASSFCSRYQQQRGRTEQRSIEQQLSFIISLFESVRSVWSLEILQGCFHRIRAFFSQMTSKLPLVCFFLFLVVYLLPLSIGFILVYAAITIMFAVPSMLVIYFSFPSMNWLIQQIMA